MKRPQKILIYRLGSLGDTVVALPALHLVAERFPSAERWVLTNMPAGPKVTPMEALLAETGLVHGYLRYPIGTRDAETLRRIRREIRQLGPDLLIYMAAPRGHIKAIRDSLFFRVCGINHQIGVPYTKSLQRPRRVTEQLYEYEGSRLLRCLKKLAPPPYLSFDLKLTKNEDLVALETLYGIGNSRRFVAASIGAKVDVQDWGDQNWMALLTRLGKRLRGWGLVMGGSADERERTERLISHWSGPVVNLCGEVGIRVYAAILQRSSLYIGHDSGPMHLAAAVGTPIVAIFSSHNLPGEWFPSGGLGEILYTPMPCQGCQLDVCAEKRKACINAITVEQVEKVVLRYISDCSEYDQVRSDDEAPCLIRPSDSLSR